MLLDDRNRQGSNTKCCCKKHDDLHGGRVRVLPELKLAVDRERQKEVKDSGRA
jgi:hypothetical protein